MKSNPRLALLLLVAIGVVMTGGGCNTGLVPQPPVTTNAAAGAPAADPLNAVVSGDVAAGFRDHVDAIAEAAEVAADPAKADGFGGFGLSDEQRAQIEALQMRLDNGEITAEEFATQVDAVLGDRAPNAAFGGLHFFGSPFGQRLEGLIADVLGLSEEQMTEVRAIFERTHAQIRRLRIEALANIWLQLTDEQQAKLQQLSDEGFASIREDGGFSPGTMSGRGLPPDGGHRHGAIRERMRGFFERLANAIGVTEEQRVAIERIRTALREEVKAAHAAAREAFRALLTPEQLATLERIEARIDEWRGEKETTTP